jgi:N-acetylmuramoyl-L-alanine amidase
MTSQRNFGCLWAAIPLMALLAVTSAWLMRVQAQAEPKQLAVYAPQSTYSVPMVDVKGSPYIGLMEVLQPLGTVEARRDGKKYKVQFTPANGKKEEVQFQDGKDKGKVRANNFKLAGNFAFQGDRGYVPLTSIPGLLSQLLSVQVGLHESAQRLLIGDVGTRYSFDLRKGTPSRLLVGFSSPVNPTISTEPGYVRLIFKRAAVVSSGPDSVTFDDPLITGAFFSEHDGIAQLDITGKSALMANFADGGKTIIITGAPAPVVAAPPPPAPTTPPPAVAQQAPKPQPPAPPRFLVLIDPAHGGDDIGAAISPTLPEKDIVLALARRVQRQLAAKGIASNLLRTGDVSMPIEQRAVVSNALRPALYLSIHAANTGKGVHVFTSLLPEAMVSPGGFLPWDTAQASFLDLSGVVAGSVAAELEIRKLPNTTLSAPLRPMNNIAAPAIAIELAPAEGDVNSIASAAYQDQVAQSIAAGVAAVRSKLPEVAP